MTTIEWGPEIEKGSDAWLADQRQPEWLKGDPGRMMWRKRDRWGGESGCLVADHNWRWYTHDESKSSGTTAIRLPANHWAYCAIEKGFVPWAGGDAAPADWDGGAYLMASGILSGGGCDWSRNPVYKSQGCYVIGYRRKDALREPDDIGKYKLVARATRAEWLLWLRAIPLDTAIQAIEALNLIREPTKAERVADKTGVDVATVKRILDAADE